LDLRRLRVSSKHACKERRSRTFEIFVECGGGIFGGGTRSVFVGLTVTVLTLVAAFLLDFLLAGFVAAGHLGSGLYNCPFSK
jgi:hypothetical protein